MHKMQKYDLTLRMARYLDPHLLLPILEFLSSREIFLEHELTEAKIETLKGTKMIDLLISIEEQRSNKLDVIKELTNQRSIIISELYELQATVSHIIDFINNERNMIEMEGIQNNEALVRYLEREIDFKTESIYDFLKLAKFRYECGNYQITSSYLYFYTLIVLPGDKEYLKVLWGKLASEILMKFQTPIEDIHKLREYIDSNLDRLSSVEQLNQRNSLVHWSLFAAFESINGLDMLINLFLYKPYYLSAIQTLSPHLLRYLTAAVVIKRSDKKQINDLVRVIKEEVDNYQDPLTEFMLNLYDKFDFDEAQKKLKVCKDVMENDFFLHNCADEFINSARLLMVEIFCRVHQCIKIKTLAEWLNMNPAVAEIWIVNLIRDAGLKAKIDCGKGYVEMLENSSSFYEKIIEKMDALYAKTATLEGLVEKKANAKNKHTTNSMWY